MYSLTWVAEARFGRGEIEAVRHTKGGRALVALSTRSAEGHLRVDPACTGEVPQGVFHHPVPHSASTAWC